MGVKLHVSVPFKVASVSTEIVESTGKKYRKISAPFDGEYDKKEGKSATFWVDATGWMNDKGEWPPALRNVDKGSVVIVNGQLAIKSYKDKDGIVRQQGRILYPSFDFCPNDTSTKESAEEKVSEPETAEEEADPFKDEMIA